MAGGLKVFSDELRLLVESSQGTFRLDRESGKVSLEGEVDFRLFTKMYKEMKRKINKELISAPESFE